MKHLNQSPIRCNFPNAKILVVDDTEEFLKLISLTLKQAGYTKILTSLDPTHVTDLVLTEKPDVILLDFEMPGMTGHDVLQCIVAKKPNCYLPVLILTANDELDIRRQCLQSGAQDFISKPFDKFDLLLKINNIIHVSMMYKQLESENLQLGDTVRVQKTAINTERNSRQHAEERLQHHIYHDLLTDLPNKILFNKYLSREIEHAQSDENELAVFVIVIDNLRDINYTLGHVNGDRVIKTFSERLLTCSQGNDEEFHRYVEEQYPLARISGNSFAILTVIDKKRLQCQTFADKISHTLDEPISINELRITLQYHIGIVYYPDHGDDADTLLKRGDIAAYQAQTLSTAIQVYSKDSDEFTKSKLELAQSLKQAISGDKLDLYLQPKLSLHSHAVIGFEFLLRWHDVIHGFVPPEKIVATAENTGLISALTRWVIKRAFQIGKRLYDNGNVFSLAINVTASDLLDSETLPHLKKMLLQYNIDAKNVIFEITEGTMIHDPVKTMESIRQYRELGVKLSIDDFGTGYSSLAYLQKLKLDELKIDRSFIMDLDTDTNNQKIVQSIIDIAHHLNLSVVAEGIENQKIYELLMKYKCDIAQGYHMARPMPEQEVQQYLLDLAAAQQPPIRKAN